MTVLIPDEAEILDMRFSDADELVSIVVPAFNEEDAIRACLASIQRQDHRTLEVLVVDGASEDATPDVVRALASDDHRIRLLENSKRRIPTSLNVGLWNARGRWFVRVDAHSTVPTNYVRTLISHLRTGEWGGVGGRKDAVGRDRVGRAIAAALGSPFGVGNSAYHYATAPREVDHVPFGGYPTTLLRSLGGWNEDLHTNEDYEMDHRIRSAGYRLLLDPSVTIEWQARESIRDLFDQYRRYGRGKADVAWRHPRSLKLRHLVPPALVAALGGAAVLAVRRPTVGLAVAAPYLAGLAAAGAITAARADDVSAAPLVAASFATMLAAWGIGMYEGLAHNASEAARRVSGRAEAPTRTDARRLGRSEAADTTSTSSRRAT